MLVLKYFATVGTVLTAAILALSAYLEPSSPGAAARMPRSTTTASVFIVAPEPKRQDTIEPAAALPKAASTPASAHAAHHRNRSR